MRHEHVILGVGLLSETGVIVLVPDVEVLTIMDAMMDSLEEENIPNSPDTMALAAVMNRFPCKPRFQNLVGMPIIRINFCTRQVCIQDTHAKVCWQGSFQKYIDAHEKRDFSAGRTP